MLRSFLIVCLLAASTLAQDAPSDSPPIGVEALSAFEHAKAVVFGDEQPSDAALAVWGVAVTLRHGARERTVAASMALDMPDAGLVAAVARALPQPRAASDRLTIELAGRPVPIDSGRGLGEATLAISPGLDAIAVRVGGRVETVFPDAALADGMLPTDMIIAAVRRAMDGLLPPGHEPGPGAWERYVDAALRRGEIDLFRAPATVLAQPPDTDAPRFVHRGGRVVARAELTPQALVDWAGDMADNLRRRQHDGLEPYGLLGTPDALTGRATVPVEDPFAQALAAHALARYAASPWAPPERAGRAGTAALVLLRQLAFVTPVRLGALAEMGDNAPLEVEAWSAPAPAAMALIALEHFEEATIEAHPELSAMRDRCAAIVRSTVGLSITGQAVFAPELPENARALAARALLALSRGGIAREDDLAHAHAAARAVAERQGPEMLVSQMPWLFEALPVEGFGPAAQAGHMADALRQMRELVRAHTLSGPEVAGPDHDLAGGVVFTRGGPPLPTWQTARAALALAAMLGDDRLTPGQQRPAEFLHLLHMLRFLRQLTVDDSMAHLLADASKSAGGLRAAPWDQRQPAVATALALLAVCEAIDAAGVRGP